MGKAKLSLMVDSVVSAAKEHSPEILSGLGIAGMISTTVVAVRATPKALRLMDEVKDKHACDTDRRAYAKDVVKKVAPVYIPALLIGSASIACLIGASRVSLNRNAALAAAYTLSETTLREYKEKVVETIGEEKEQTVRDAIAKDKIEKNPVSNNEVIVINNGDTLYFDPMIARYFKCNKEKLKQAENEINSQMLDEGSVNLNDFYYAIGLEDACVGNVLGWNYNRDRFVRLSLSSQLTEDGTPCVVLGFQTAPYYGYDKY